MINKLHGLSPSGGLGGKNLLFVSSRSVKMRGFTFLSFYTFFNDEIHNYVLFAIIVHFDIQKLENKQTFIQTEKAKSSHFDRTRRDKNHIFPT